MKKNEIFTFTAPDGVEVTAVAINRVAYEAEQQKFNDECYEALSSIGDIDF